MKQTSNVWGTLRLHHFVRMTEQRTFERPTMRRLIALALIPLIAAQAAPPQPKKLTPNDVISAAPAGSWRQIAPEDLLVVTLEGNGRLVVQLAPEFAPVH
ncbi:MAG TPA: hypothetical protein VNJ05_06000, partial [Sphingomicrobium sp.]|nr:hypothetical protein [Sphingomicrobium sp.]